MAYSTVGGYGSALVNSDGSLLVDGEDGVPVLGPMFSGFSGAVTTATGSLAPGLAVSAGIPIMNAVLIELRILNDLINRDRTGLDLSQMRADELFNITIGLGAL